MGVGQIELNAAMIYAPADMERWFRTPSDRTSTRTSPSAGGDANEEYQRDLVTQFEAERGDDWEGVEERYKAAATELRKARAAVEELIEAVPFDELAPPEVEGPEPRGGIDGALSWSGRSSVIQTAVLHDERALLAWRLEADEEE